MATRRKNYTVSVDYSRECFYIWDGNGNRRLDLRDVDALDKMAKKIEEFLNSATRK